MRSGGLRSALSQSPRPNPYSPLTLALSPRGEGIGGQRRSPQGERGLAGSVLLPREKVPEGRMRGRCDEGGLAVTVTSPSPPPHSHRPLTLALSPRGEGIGGQRPSPQGERGLAGSVSLPKGGEGIGGQRSRSPRREGSHRGDGRHGRIRAGSAWSGIMPSRMRLRRSGPTRLMAYIPAPRARCTGR